MALDPLVGIVTPCRNRREKTARFLGCIAAQEYRSLRMYLVDSNSGDGTPEMVRRCFPHVHLLTADDSMFWTGATNMGVRRALADGCEYVVTVNDDSLVDPQWLRTLVDDARRGSHHILASRIDFLHQPGQLWALGACNYWAEGKLFQLPDSGVWADESAALASRQTTLEVETLCGNGVLFHRTVFDKIGLYDEVWTPHYHADSEFVLRARRAGFAARVTTRTIVRNDVFNDAAVPASASSIPPAVRPGDFLSLWRRFAHDGRKLFLSIRSDYYWRALLVYIWRHCPRPLLVQCTRAFTRRVWERFFEANWQAYRATAPSASNVATGIRLWRQPLEASRAPVPHGEFSMEVLDSIDAAAQDEFVDAAYQGIFGRAVNGDTSGFEELAETRAGRDRVVNALLGSLEARLMNLSRRVTPLAKRMMAWRNQPSGAISSRIQHVAEDIDKVGAFDSREMVHSAYREFLRRDPEAEVVAMQIAAAERSPEKLMAALLLSQEYKLDERRGMSTLLRRWTLWASTYGRDRDRPVREVPADRLAKAVGQ